MKSKKQKSLGVYTDDPKVILKAAVDEVPKGVEFTLLKLRQSSEKAWLAACTVADVAAHRLGMPKPGGKIARLAALREVEVCARLSTQSLTARFENVQRNLHGECFHNAECPVDIGSWFEAVDGLIDDTMAALAKCRLKRRGR
jgi:hypothetical protein